MEKGIAFSGFWNELNLFEKVNLDQEEISRGVDAKKYQKPLVKMLSIWYNICRKSSWYTPLIAEEGCANSFIFYVSKKI